MRGGATTLLLPLLPLLLMLPPQQAQLLLWPHCRPNRRRCRRSAPSIVALAAGKAAAPPGSTQTPLPSRLKCCYAATLAPDHDQLPA